MSIHLEFTPRPGYLLVEATGKFQLDEARDAFVRILDACIEHDRPKVLADFRKLDIETPLGTVDSFEYAEAEARSASIYRARGLTAFRIAYVGTREQIDPNHFGETVATNRGVRTISTWDMAAALAWLGVAGDDSPPEQP